jgi:3-dehydroquinate synthase
MRSALSSQNDVLQIQSRSHPYTVAEFSSVGAALAHPGGSAAPFYLVDQRVAGLYGRQLADATCTDRLIAIEASEEAKSYEQLAPVFCRLLDAGCRRDSQLVVVGGGVLQDMGCFIASVLFRGVRWTLLPTTLLAQCDSCIGSKSSLNIHRFKNQLGTFYPPHEVRLAFEFLETLSAEEIQSGLGEAIKLHLIDGEAATERLRRRLSAAGGAELPLSEIVRDSLRIKQRYIEADEFDRGVRNVLNYGHTFAHAFESATRYAIPHGIAVSLGVACATFFSERLGMVPPGSQRRLLEWLRPCFGGHARTLRQADLLAVVGAMRQDKKNDGDQVTFILTRGPGKMEKVRLEAQTALALLGECCETL